MRRSWGYELLHDAEATLVRTPNWQRVVWFFAVVVLPEVLFYLWT